jgi:hypothetical protein
MMMNSGDLYPLPRMSCRYPLSNGRTLDVDLPARVMRTALGARTDTPPVIDGDVSDTCWESCSAVTRLNPGYDEPVEGETEFAFACDADNLYLSAVCYDPKMVDVTSDVTDRDGPVYSDDCIGYFLQPNPDSMVVYQIYVNPAGAVFDQKITFDESMWYDANRAWDGEYDVATQSVDNRWSVEMKIPLSQLGGDIEKNPVWRVNFRRKQARTGTTSDWQVPIDYNPRTFGELEFK